MPKKRCYFEGCKMKIKLTDMACKCTNVFCNIHRLPETHKCTWNFKNNKEMEIYREKAGLNINSSFKKLEII